MNKELKLSCIAKYLFIELIALLVLNNLLQCYAITLKDWFLTIYVILVALATVLIIKFAKMEWRINTISFCTLKTDAMMPEKRMEDAGYDIYACFDSGWMEIAPHETKMIPTGIASVFNEQYVAILKERGSTGTKGIGQRSGVIDSGYRGEWMVPVTNHNDVPIVILKEDCRYEFEEVHKEDMEDYTIYPYEKAICQMVLLPVPLMNIKQINQAELAEFNSERGAGKLGSSGK